MAKNICIYFSDTGGGHRSATDALEAGIRELLARCEDQPDVKIIKDPIAERSHPINRRFVELYNYLLRNHQPLMKYYYWFLHLLRPEKMRANLDMSLDFLANTLVEHAPSVVVSVHPMINHGLAGAMKKNGMAGNIELACVVTDPNKDLWRAWACDDVDWYAAPNILVKEKLTEWGVMPEKIDITGMSVNPSFIKPSTISRQEFLTHLGLAADQLTLCINAGWAGGGNMLKAYKALSRANKTLQVIFLCGHNGKLYEKAMEAAAESEIPTAVLPFHDSMPDLMSSVDLMVTKAGGLTTYEAVARRLPLAFDLITEPMPQERGTAEMMVAEKLAYAIHRPEDIIGIINQFRPAPNRATVKMPTEHNYDLTDTAVYTIAERVLNMAGITVPPAKPSDDADKEPLYLKVI